jgi:hypothetical protein
MKASDIILLLQKAVQEHGDLDVTLEHFTEDGEWSEEHDIEGNLLVVKNAPEVVSVGFVEVTFRHMKKPIILRERFVFAIGNKVNNP